MPLRVRDYRRVVDFAVGDTASRNLIFGGMSREEEGQQWQLARLRIAYRGASLGDAITATIRLADGGSIIGPLDLPIVIDIEEPPDVQLTPVSIASLTTIVLSLTPVFGGVAESIANSTITSAGAGVTYDLPQWVRRVSAGVVGTYQYQDRAHAALSSASGDLRLRPTAASEVLMVAAGSLTFWY
jgi:hypothetical protein